jgi:hypothetical protein
MPSTSPAWLTLGRALPTKGETNMASKGINVKVKRDAIIKALHDRLTDMIYLQEEYEREVEACEKAKLKWTEDVAKITLKLLDVKTIAEHTSVRKGFYNSGNRTNVMIDVMIDDDKLPVEPEGVVNPFRDTWSGKTYLGNYEERVAEIKNAITILNMCEEDTVNTSTYANVAKYL